MNNKIIGWVVIVVVIIGGYFLFTKDEKDKQSGEPIKIGAVLSLTGAAAQDGESIKNGLELAKSDLKKKGVEVEIIYQDDRTDAKDTVSAINALNVQGVQAMIGPTWSFLGDAGVPVADRLKLVNVQPANTSEYVTTNGSSYAFFTTTKVEKIMPTLSKWLKDNSIKKIAIIRNQGAWYETVYKALNESAVKAGATIVFDEEFPFGGDTNTMATLIVKAKGAGADMLFAEVDEDKGVLTMLKKSQELNLQIPIMSVTTAVGRVINENKTLTFKNEVFVISPESSKEFEDKFKTEYKKEMTAYADRAYDSLMLLVEAIQNKDDASLQEYLKNKTNYKGYIGTYNFDEKGDIEGGTWIIKQILK